MSRLQKDISWKFTHFLFNTLNHSSEKSRAFCLNIVVLPTHDESPTTHFTTPPRCCFLSRDSSRALHHDASLSTSCLSQRLSPYKITSASDPLKSTATFSRSHDETPHIPPPVDIRPRFHHLLVTNSSLAHPFSSHSLRFR